ncbi:MAG: hypothetical protein QOJ91_1835 [Sphingomonadales bacterium]|nr:hypothetical protein [Sphingomonadales bacterium]
MPDVHFFPGLAGHSRSRHHPARRFGGDRPLARRAPVRLRPRARLANLRFFATGDDFPRAYRGLAPNGDEWASLDVWTKKDGIVRHFWGASESGGTADPGQDPHLAPDPTPLWNILDLTPEGRGTDWYPSLEY